MNEDAKVARLRAILGGEGDPRITLGVGDDCAILAPVHEPLVFTIDEQVEGVHFRRDLLSLEDVGFRATTSAASDLAAMGARPIAMLASIVVPPDLDDDALDAIARGQRAASDRIGASIAGGNLARGAALSISTTCLGAAPKPLRRDGARPGDHLFVAGDLGLAAAGFAILASKLHVEGANEAIAAWRRPTARIAEGLRAASIATAAIDVSDGLVLDLTRLARASGVAIVIDEARFDDARLARIAPSTGRAALDLALYGGEDYALVIAAKGATAIEGFRSIGEVVEKGNRNDDAPVALRTRTGAITPLASRGFDHFA